MEREELHKEIDLIQSCISRMCHNSFMIKGWALTIYAGVCAFTKGDNFMNIPFFTISTIIPILCFWIIDAFFVNTEIKYRKMYETILLKRRNDDIDGQYSLNPKGIKVESVFKTMVSTTLALFYGIPMLSAIAYYIFIQCFR